MPSSSLLRDPLFSSQHTGGLVIYSYIYMVTGGPSRLSQLRTVKSEWLRKFSDFLFLSSEFSPQIGAHSQALEALGKGARDLEDR